MEQDESQGVECDGENPPQKGEQSRQSRRQGAGHGGLGQRVSSM